MKPEIEKLKKKKAKIELEISKLQKECPHENVKIETESNISYLNECNQYWLEIDCHDCGIHFSVDYDKCKDEYQKWANRLF